MSSGELSVHATTPREPTGKKTPALSFAEGARVGGYQIVSAIGGGGMGRVFLAEDQQLARRVALKILPPEDADDEGRARFLREAQALARVTHKNVVQVFASGVDAQLVGGGVAWMALEYVVGDPLGALVEGGAVDEETALSLCGQAARGLAAVHDVGVVHRDVKPDNLLVDENAIVRVCDFGVALFIEGTGVGGFVTQKGVAVGTPHFMAPEQARGGTIDARADAWGLGATLFTLLTGRPPFYTRDDEPDLDILARVLRERAPDVRTKKPVTAGTAALVAKLLEPDLDQRLADMREIAAACDEIADAIATGAASPSPAPTPAATAATSSAAASASGGAAADAASAGAAMSASATGAATSSGATATATATTATASEATTAAGAKPMSRFRVLALALSFAGLGAVVTYRVAEQLVEVPPPPPPKVVEVQVQPPPPAEVKLPIAEDPPPPAPPPPTAEELEARVAQDPSAHRAELLELVAMTSNDAKASVVRLASASGALGDVTIDTIANTHAVHHFGAIEHAILTGDRARAQHAIDDLAAAKPFEALDLLGRVAKNAKDKKTREQAREAKDALFHVESP